MRRPSPSMAVALTALFVALGGTGYALISNGIPDGAGIFHGCANRRTGALRLVVSATSCQKAVTKGKHKRPGELPVAWSQRGPAGANGASGANGANGTTVTLRSHGEQPLTTSNTTQAFTMANVAWSQSADEVDQLVGTVNYHAPSSSNCSAMGVGVFASLSLTVKVDGTYVGGLILASPDGADHTTQIGLSSFADPGAVASHTLSVEALDTCGAGGGAATEHFTIKSVKIDVLAAH